MKDEVLHSLLPRAFSRFSQTFLWIDTVNNLIAVDCASGNRDLPLSADDLEKQLDAFTFSPCGSQDMAQTGWVSPMGNRGEALAHEVNGQIVICARTEQKILPSHDTDTHGLFLIIHMGWRYSRGAIRERQ
ncbi:hypothetical protein CRX72_10045 [Pantoea sp. BRM17]|nr:hypothetical protein CRX72_10045 [Pantoea sp. BRM17]